MRKARISRTLDVIAAIRGVEAARAQSDAVAASREMDSRQTERAMVSRAAERLARAWQRRNADTPAPELHAGWIGRSNDMAVDLDEADRALAVAKETYRQALQQRFVTATIEEDAQDMAHAARLRLRRKREDARLSESEDRRLAQWRTL